MTRKTLAVLAALSLFTGVAAGAFGAHGLRAMLSPQFMSIWQTGVLYHLVHGLGLLGLAALTTPDGPRLGVAGWLLFAGIVLFSGSLYLLALTQILWLGAITPIGGTAFLAGWAIVGYKFWRHA